MTLGLWGIKDNDISKYEPDSGYLTNKTSKSNGNLLDENSKTELPLNDAGTTISYGKETVYPYTEPRQAKSGIKIFVAVKPKEGLAGTNQSMI